jgi:MFS family permease
VVTQTTEMLLALMLAVLVATHQVTYADVLILALLLGVANSIDMPTRQAFVVELVGPDDLMNAIALNSSLFNTARLVGPALAGLLIGVIGIAGLFYLNALSFIAVIVGLLLMHPPTLPPRHLSSFDQVWRDLREGLQYVQQMPLLVAVILLTGALGTFGANFNVVVPLLAAGSLHVGATGLGWLLAAMGLGSLVASLALAYLGREAHPRLLIGSGAAFALLEMLLAPVSSFNLALVLLTLIGAAMVTFSAVANTFVQLTVPHRLRGRVMSLYTTIFVGTTPIGNTLAGAAAELGGTFAPLFFGGLITLLATVALGPAIWGGCTPETEAHLDAEAAQRPPE